MDTVDGMANIVIDQMSSAEKQDVANGDLESASAIAEQFLGLNEDQAVRVAEQAQIILNKTGLFTDPFWTAPFDWKNAASDTWGLECQFIELDRPVAWQSADKSADQKEEIVRRAKAREAGMRCSFDDKLDFAKRCIKRALERVPQDHWYISWSAGNDSTALSCLMRLEMGLKVHHVMSNTRLEYPETIRNMHKYVKVLEADNCPVTITYPDKKPPQVWKESGIPLYSKELASKYRQWIATGNDNHLKYVPDYLHEPFRRLRDAGIMLTDKCCDELKKKPMKKVQAQLGFKGTFTGVRAAESRARKLAYIQRGALYNSTRNRQWICNPLIHWSHEGVVRMLDRHNIVLERPGNGTGRSGCVNCGFGCHIAQREGTRNSLQILFDTNITMWNRTMKDWGFEEACVIAGIDTK